jgi:outer membrane putative beta-barrel porin/alpha-amylase
MKRVRMVGPLAVLALSALLPSPVFGQTGDPNEDARRLTAAFISDHLGPRIQDNVPLVAPSSSLTYRFNPQLDVWERAEVTLGSIFLDRAETLGRGFLDVSVSYGYAHYAEVNGRSLFSELVKDDPAGTDTVFRFQLRDVELQLISFAGTYGLTEDIELSLVVPLERISIVSRFDTKPLVIESDELREDNVGVGDIAMGGKWVAVRSDYANIAAKISLKVPSGDADRALGLGDTILTPTLLASKTFWGSFEPHLQLGIETNLDELDESRCQYAAGVTYQPYQDAGGLLRAIGLTVDFVGRVDLDVPDNRNRGSFFGTSRQENVMDIAPGAKFALGKRGVVFASVQLPLNDDSLRADIVPVGGVELVF